MTQPSSEDKVARLGDPSHVWRFGQERRLGLIQQHVCLKDKRILDAGCGIGMYMKAMRRLSERVFGVDVEPERVADAHELQAHVVVATAEKLPFPQGSFDAVLLHEVIEHVEDDQEAIREACRVLAPGGRMAVFAPNRLYPLETHGLVWRGEHHFGNAPFINWLPDCVRDRLAPHVRAYSRGRLCGLFTDLPMKAIVHTQVFAGYDKISARWPTLGLVLRRMTYCLERTSLRVFGLSHFLVMEKTE